MRSRRLVLATLRRITIPLLIVCVVGAIAGNTLSIFFALERAWLSPAPYFEGLAIFLLGFIFLDVDYFRTSTCLAGLFTLVSLFFLLENYVIGYSKVNLISAHLIMVVIPFVGLTLLWGVKNR